MFIFKKSFWPTCNLFYRSGDFQILENKKTNSKKGFHSVKKLSNFSDYNTEMMVGMYDKNQRISEFIPFIYQKPEDQEQIIQLNYFQPSEICQ